MKSAAIGTQFVRASQIVFRSYATKPDKASELANKLLKNNAKTVTNERGTYKITTLTPKEWEAQCEKNLKAIIERDLEKRGLSHTKKS